VAFHEEVWAVGVGHAVPIQQDPLLDSITTTPSLRSNMLWRILNENSRFLQAFIAVPEQDHYRLCFATFSKLCYALISQAKVAFALLDLISTSNCMPERVEADQTAMVQLIVDKVGYNRHCSLLIEKFAAASSPAFPAAGRKDTMVHFGVLSMAMMKRYSKQLQIWLGGSGLNLMESNATGLRN
jgi:hypothetical protein